jgi:hypothetical protein
MDLVLIPTFARPEYLHLCLEHLRQADGGTEKHVWIAQDSHHRDSVDQKSRNAESRGVAERARPYFADVRFIPRQPHGYVGNPYNFLELYREAFVRMLATFIWSKMMCWWEKISFAGTKRYRKSLIISVRWDGTAFAMQMLRVQMTLKGISNRRATSHP